MRWETTRRHPYYQLFWQDAKNLSDREQSNDGDTSIAARRQVAVAILYGIGVTSVYPDPRTPFEALSARQELEVAWLPGAVHPLTFGGLAALMVTALPKDTLNSLAILFAAAAAEDRPAEPPTKVQIVNELFWSRDRALANYPDAPYVSLNPAASQRQIADAVRQIVTTFKKRLGLSEQRDRSDKYSAYLAVWDDREGWDGGDYSSNERPFAEIAKDRKKAISTLSNHYRSAFELISGHPYSPSAWFRVMGPLKLSKLAQQVRGQVTTRRPQKSPTRKPVDNTTLSGSVDAGQGPTDAASSKESLGLIELMADIHDLLGKGRTNDEIVQELDLALPEASAAIEAIRRRQLEGL